MVEAFGAWGWGVEESEGGTSWSFLMSRWSEEGRSSWLWVCSSRVWVEVWKVQIHQLLLMLRFELLRLLLPTSHKKKKELFVARYFLFARNLAPVNHKVSSESGMTEKHWIDRHKRANTHKNKKNPCKGFDSELPRWLFSVFLYSTHPHDKKICFLPLSALSIY